MKNIAVTTCLILLATAGARAQELQAPPSAQEPPVLLARWDVLLSDAGMESLDQVDRKPIESASKGYQPALYDANALRAAINAAKSLGGVDGVNQNMAFSLVYRANDTYHMNNSLYFGYYGDGSKKVGLNGNGSGQERLSAGDDGKSINIKLDYAEVRLQMREVGAQSFTNVPGPLAIVYDGRLAAGEAIAMRGALKAANGQTYYHVVVWEAFRAEQRHMQHIQVVQGADTWCELGPDGIRAASDVAAIWASRAKHPPSQVTQKWERKLEDGKVLRLTGLTRSDKWRFCWWDADGQPVGINYGVSISSSSGAFQLWFNAELTAGEDEWKKQGPTGNSGQEHQQHDGAFQAGINTFVNEKGEAVVGVPVGDWEKFGQLTKSGGTIKVGDDTYRMRPFTASGSSEPFYVSFQREQPRGRGAVRTGATAVSESDSVTLTAVFNDDTELDPNYVTQMAGENYGTSTPNFNGRSAKDVKTFHVWRRKRQWVRFTDFAKEPLVAPPAQVTPAEITAVLGPLETRLHQSRPALSLAQQLMMLSKRLALAQARRAEWAAVPAEPATPKGAIRAMMAAAATGDRAAVRKRLSAKQPDAGPTLDLLAQYITTVQHTWVTAVARYGEPAIAPLAVIDHQPGGFMDIEAHLFTIDWQPADDGGLTGAELRVLKGEGGEYFLDVSTMLEQAGNNPDMISKIRTTTERIEQVARALTDNPAMTFQEFRAQLNKAKSAALAPG